MCTVPYACTSQESACSQAGRESLSQSDTHSYCGCGHLLSPVGSENHTLFFHCTTLPWVIELDLELFCCRKFTQALADSFLPVCVYSTSCITCLQSLLDVMFWKISCHCQATILVALGSFFLSVFMTFESYMLFSFHLPIHEMDIILTFLTICESFISIKRWFEYLRIQVQFSPESSGVLPASSSFAALLFPQAYQQSRDEMGAAVSSGL